MYSEKEVTKLMLECVLPEFTKYVRKNHTTSNHQELKGAFYTSFRRYLPTLVNHKHSIYGTYSQNNFAVLHVNTNGIIEQLEFEVVGRGGYTGFTDEGIDLLNHCVSKFDFEKESMSLGFDKIINAITMFNPRMTTTV